MRALLLAACLIALVLTCLFAFGKAISGPENHAAFVSTLYHIFGR